MRWYGFRWRTWTETRLGPVGRRRFGFGTRVQWGGVRLTDSVRPPVERRSTVTAAHLAALARVRTDPTSGLAGTALWACLESLRTTTLTEAADVLVDDAWTDGSTAIVVVYRAPWAPGRVGLRRNLPVLAELTFEHDPEAETCEACNPTTEARARSFGVRVAQFDIGEPLGSYALNLRTDADGIGWWGDLDEGPGRPERRDP